MSDALIADCLLAAECLAETNTFETGQAILKEAADRIEELEAKLAKAMQVVEMIASADVDAVLGQAVDLSCEIIGELMEDE